MNIYLKVFLIVLVGTVAGWFGINHAVNSTNHLPDKFTVSSTSYLAKDPSNNLVILDTEQPKAALQTSSAADAINESLNAVNGQGSQSGNSSTTSLVIPKVSAVLIAGDEPAKLEIKDIKGDKDEEEDDKEEEEEVDEEDAEAEDERADSDSDMVERGGDGTSNKVSKNKKSKKPKKPAVVKKVVVQALDIAFAPPAESTCVIPGDDYLRVDVNYRQGSQAIKGQSLSGIDQLVKLHRKCGGGKLLILQNDEGLKNTEERLIQLRQDEIKYYLLQRNIPKDDMIFPDNS